MDHDETIENSDNLTGAWPPILVGFLMVVVVGGLTDIVLDRPKSWFTAHIAVEVGMVLVSLSFAVLIFSRWQRSQRTVRQQAVEVYRKAGVQGRSELAAFFLADITLPS